MNIKNVSIFRSLGDPRNTRVTYVQPQPGSGLILLHNTPTPQSPAAKVLAVRSLVLKPGQAIPFHVHERKEKVYSFMGDQQGQGVMEFLIYENGKLGSYFLREVGSTLVIPPGVPHALVCCGGHTFCQVTIIASSQDATDIEWEPGVELLTRNLHLTAG